MIDFNWLTESFDLPIMRVLQGTESLFMDRFVLMLTAASTWLPLYIALVYMVLRNNKSVKQSLFVILFAFIAVGIAGFVSDEIMKPYFMRLRPGHDKLLKYTIDVIYNKRSSLFGFVSSHACNTMTCAVFFSLIVKNKTFAAVLILWSLLNGYTRIYLGVHYPSDVVAGFICGGIIATAVYYAYSYVSGKFVARTAYISKRFTPTGYAYSDIYTVYIVLVLLLLYALFRSVFEL